jgi:glucosamine--fructose-6-phosphate aminotransferase (isomerizing)
MDVNPRGSGLRQMIAAQPAALRAVAGLDVSGSAERLRSVRRLYIVGTGTSFHAAELGAYLLSSGGVDARAVRSSDLARWRPALVEGDGAVVISHTGETAYARAACAQVLGAGRPLVTITGEAAGWPDAIETPTKEKSETYTVSYTAALAVLGLLAHALTGTQTGPEALVQVAAEVELAISAPGISEIGVPTRALALVGPGIWGVTAREGALKVREAAQILSEGFDSESLLHGPAVPYGADDTLIAVAAQADVDGLTQALLAAARTEGLTSHSIAGPAAGAPDPAGRSDAAGSAAAALFLAQIPVTVRLQLLAAQLSELKGTDPDHAITGAWAEPALWGAGAPSA